MGLSPGGGIELGIGNGHGAKTGDRGNQRLLFPGETTLLARIDQNSTLAERGAKRSGQQRPRRDQVSERVGCRINGNADWLPCGHGARAPGRRLKADP